MRLARSQFISAYSSTRPALCLTWPIISDNEFISGVVKKSYGLTFEQGGMSSFMMDFSDRYQKIKVPSEFPRSTRPLFAAGDLKASEWRNIAIIGFVVLNEVFDDVLDDNSAKAKKIRDLRFFWLLTVIDWNNLTCIAFTFETSYLSKSVICAGLDNVHCKNCCKFILPF